MSPRKKPAADSTGKIDPALRQRAEQALRKLAAHSPEQLGVMPPEELRRTLHELQVHKLELEMQNDELRRAQAELDLSRARYFDLYALAPTGYCTVGEPGLILETNLAAGALMGVARGALVGQPFTRFVHREDQDAFYLLRKQLLASGGPRACELGMVKFDGTRFLAQVAASLAPGDGGAPVLFLMLSDITERRRIEEALKESAARYRAISEFARDAVVTSDAAGKIVGWNSGAVRVFGHTEEQALGQSVWMLIPSGSKDNPLADVRSARAEPNDKPVELTGVRRDGSELPLELTVSEWQSAEGRFVTAIARDVSERKRLLASAAQSDRLAAMGLLAAGIAHEINNPLTWVLSNLEALVEELPKAVAVTGAEPVTPLAVEFAQSALEGTRRIEKISRSLGAFSRVDRGKLGCIDLRVPIDSAATMAHNEVRYRATLIKDLGATPPVLASEGKLSQLFLNLIINAAHAIPEGDAEGNRITIRTWASGGDVFAEVADTGPGIPTENLERIFEPFFTTKKAGVGTGLGLAICRNIATGFGGDLHVESQPGKGTRLVLRLPATTRAPATSALPVEAAPAPPGPRVRGRILVVDDEVLLTKALQRGLGAEHEVLCATSGKEAKALLDKDRAFDLILCDLMMPGLTGMELHAWLRQLDPALAEQVVFLSGGIFTPGAEEYLASVPNVCVSKPFEMGSLKQLTSGLVVAGRSKRRP